MKPPHKRIWLLPVLVTLFTFQVFPANAQNRREKVQSDYKKNPLDANIIASDTFMHRLLAENSQYFSEILEKKEELGLQVIYTRIDRTKKNKPGFTDHYFGVNADKYFYPASTVKLPVAILTLQRLNELNIAGLDKNSTMYTASAGERLTAVANDPSAQDGRPTVAHYIKKILLVSDNDAYNRLYEFLGQEYINTSLQKMGYVHTKIIHRLSISLS
ncbi:MAG TPA: serine hydrolase, partial [Chitinophagaceae bacterium]|nr:serine hydrolase [Chitinophagaceae bacterium]